QTAARGVVLEVGAGDVAQAPEAAELVAQVDVLAVHEEALVEAAHLVERRAPYRQAGAREPLHVAGLVERRPVPRGPLRCLGGHDVRVVEGALERVEATGTGRAVGV